MGKKKAINTNYVYLAIIAMAAVTSTALLASSGMQYMAEAFPNESTATIQSILTVNALPSAIMGLLAGFLASRFTLKQLGIFGAICMLAGGVGIAFVKSFKVILALRMLWGIGIGFNNTTLTNVVMRYLDAEKQLRAMGLRQISAQSVNLVLTLVSGYLAMISWRVPFYFYSVNLLVVIALAIALPNRANDPTYDDAVVKKKFSIRDFSVPMNTLGHCLLMFLTQCAVFVYQTNYTMLVVGNNLGTSVQVGFSTAIMSLGGILGGIALMKVSKVLKNYLLPVVLGVYTLTIAFCAFVTPNTSMWMLYINSFVHGLTFFIFNATSMLNIGVAAPVERKEAAVGLGNASYQLGMFLTPYVFVPLATKVWGRDMPQDRMLLSAIWLFIIVIIYFILSARKSPLTFSTKEAYLQAITTKE